MYVFETPIRVRYGETDQMGYVYYGNYPLYYEVARTEMLRTLGLSYKQMEAEGILLPVRSLSVCYLGAAHYDDLLTVKVMLKELPAIRIRFFYEIYNEQSILLNTGETELVFVNAVTRKPQKAPATLIARLKPYF
jgi:acyl-CoA thioester hydrolase